MKGSYTTHISRMINTFPHQQFNTVKLNKGLYTLKAQEKNAVKV